MEPKESQQGNHQGKRRILIERQPTDKKRNATFLNRRAGLLKKARELATLCGVDVTLIVFSSQGELYEFSSNTKAHILHQYLVKKQEQEGHTVDPELVALYYKLAHVEALEHEATRFKYNLELHRMKIDPRLRKFTVHELQNLNERNLLNKFEEVLQNNQKAILEFNEKKKDVRTYAELVNKEKAGGNIPLQSKDSVQNDQPPQVPQKPNEHSRYVGNEGQYRQFQHQVHMGHQEAMNMPKQTMMQQQQREFELLMATIEREDLLRCGESSSRKGRVVGRGGSSQGDIEQRMHQVGFAALRFANAQGPQQHLPNSQDMHMSYPDQTQHTWWNNETRMNFGHDSWEQHATATQPGLEQLKMFYQPPANVELDQGQDLGAQRPQVCVTDFQNMYSSNPNQAQESDEFLICGDLSEEELRELEELLDKKEEQVGIIEE